MALPSVQFVRQLSELDDEVGINVARGLVTLLLEDKLCALVVARLDLDLLHLCCRLACLGVVLHDVSLVLHSLDRPIVKLFQCAIDSDNDVLRRSGSRLVQAPKTVSKDALLSISAIKGTVLLNKISALQFGLVVVLRADFQKVTASDFLYHIAHTDVAFRASVFQANLPPCSLTQPSFRPYSP